MSHRRLRGYKRLPRAITGWALDSGGFSELSLFGRWTISESEYVEAVSRYKNEIGSLEWAAPQDWMCEPWLVEKTGLSVEEHQERTVASYLSLRDKGPFIPVLQGWSVQDYVRCRELYASAGVDLPSLPLVGLGSVCRRQQMMTVSDMAWLFSDLKLHGFGVKMDGLRKYGDLLTSADSMAWSYAGRVATREGRTSCKTSCGNHLHFALEWRENLLRPQPYQLHLV